MSERLFGVETEYALTGLSVGGGVLDRSKLLMRIMDIARKHLPHLREINDRGIFLQNASRLYIDAGCHPEITTPECANPWDVVRYIQAGERILASLVGLCESQDSGNERVSCFKCNVDYGGTCSTWGCHESYLHRADPTIFPSQIVPHLVSRLIFAGAGGFNSLSPGIEFTLSPRVPHIVNTISSSSTADRGIFHTKDESLSERGYHRLHILCGESLCSTTATWLKIGTTSLVVAMIDEGLHPGDAVQLQAPLEALRTFAGDPECKATVILTNGEKAGAISIQRHYLSQAEQFVKAPFMPPWAGEVCHQWHTMIERLQAGSASVKPTLDWAIKYPLYQDYVQRRGIAWESLPHWTAVLQTVSDALKQTEYRNKVVSVDFLLGANTPIRREIDGIAPFLRVKGLSWDGLKPILNLRQELFEIDTRFGQVGESGIFAAMDHAGVLAHGFSGVDNIEHAVNNPPSIGRARLRGEMIRRLARENGRYRCKWDAIVDCENGRILDLSNPFATEERWIDRPKGPPQNNIYTLA